MDTIIIKLITNSFYIKRIIKTLALLVIAFALFHVSCCSKVDKRDLHFKNEILGDWQLYHLDETSAKSITNPSRLQADNFRNKVLVGLMSGFYAISQISVDPDTLTVYTPEVLDVNMNNTSAPNGEQTGAFSIAFKTGFKKLTNNIRFMTIRSQYETSI